jgi:hypothetical protein
MRGYIKRCATVSGTDSQKWRQLYGTTATYNLPQHKKNQHIGHCWSPCPYSDESDSIRTEAMTGNYIDPYYVTVYHLKKELGVSSKEDIPIEDLRRVGTISGTILTTTVSGASGVDHFDYDKGKYVYMTTANRGNKWGYECTFSGCPYRAYHGKNYFHT